MTTRSTRREFVAGGASLLASGWTLPAFLARAARAAVHTGGDRILVVVQLTGGNDGLNTVVPFRSDVYRKARPTLAVPRDRALRLNDDLGLHPEMTGMKRLFDSGRLCVVGNVGYPNPDRSHFRSMDIWHAASLKPEEARDGWLGRAADLEPGEDRPPLALHLDDDALPLALRSQRSQVPSIRGIEAFRLRGGAGALEQALSHARPGAGEDLLFVQRTAIASCAHARRIEQVAADSSPQAVYPASRLAGRLRQIVQLIGADIGARIYYTSLGGFDTHAQQALAHGPLLRELSDALAAFHEDLKARRLDERVMLMTFSEFGRRVHENGSRGTDHGAAAPMFLAGPACTPGIVGGAPDLDRLQEGDVPHEIDFRRVYAAVLSDWLGLDAAQVLGARYDALGIVCGRA